MTSRTKAKSIIHQHSD